MEKEIGGEEFIWSLNNIKCKISNEAVSKEFMEKNGINPEWLVIIDDGK